MWKLYIFFTTTFSGEVVQRQMTDYLRDVPKTASLKELRSACFKMITILDGIIAERE